MAALADEPLDEPGLLTAGTRLGLQASAVDLASTSLDELPMPFALVGDGLPARVVAAAPGGRWTVLDVVEGRVFQMTAADVRTLGSRALVLRERWPQERPADWYSPLWARVRPVIAKLALAALLTSASPRRSS